MQGILGTLELLSLDPSLKQNQRELIDTAVECSKHLMGVLSDSLDLSKLEAKKMTLENVPFDFLETCHEVINVMSPLALKKGITLDLDVEPTVSNSLSGDPWRFKQVLYK
jgi:signal transduction histidine kinase